MSSIFTRQLAQKLYNSVEHYHDKNKNVQIQKLAIYSFFLFFLWQKNSLSGKYIWILQEVHVLAQWHWNSITLKSINFGRI